MYLDLEKLEGKKKNLKSNFFSIVWYFGLRKVKRKKNREEKGKENLCCYEKKLGEIYFLSLVWNREKI